MTTARIRSLLAVTAIAAVFAYGLSGHGLPQIGHDGMAGAGAGVCFLLAAALACVVMPRPERRPAVLVFDAAPRYGDAPARPPLDARARASPASLQRFLN
jgi:hypothetical protein